jgi:hypothetical protein
MRPRGRIINRRSHAQFLNPLRFGPDSFSKCNLAVTVDDLVVPRRHLVATILRIAPNLALLRVFFICSFLRKCKPADDVEERLFPGDMLVDGRPAAAGGVGLFRLRTAMKPETLLVFPYVKVRVSCPCGYRKAYRLARVAEVLGADRELDDVLFMLICGHCPKWGE